MNDRNSPDSGVVAPATKARLPWYLYLTRFDKIWISLFSVVIALLIGVAIIVGIGRDPVKAYAALWKASFGGMRDFGELLVAVTPLIFTGLSVGFAFRTGLFNIGAEGQFIVGQMAAAYLGYAITGLPTVVHVTIALAGGALAGAVWAGIPGYLRAKRGAHEVITTIMMNYIALYLTNWLVAGPLKGHSFLPVTKTIESTAQLWRFLPPTRANIGFFIALLMAYVVYRILWKSKVGYELRAVGLNPSAAEYGGIKVSRNLVTSMLIAGALAGMGGAVQILGIQHKFYQILAFTGYGFDGIAVALLGNNHPAGTVAGAFLFGFLARGAGRMQSAAEIPKEIVGIIQGLIIVFIASDEFVRRVLLGRWMKKVKALETAGETTGSEPQPAASGRQTGREG